MKYNWKSAAKLESLTKKAYDPILEDLRQGDRVNILINDPQTGPKELDGRIGEVKGTEGGVSSFLIETTIADDFKVGNAVTVYDNLSGQSYPEGKIIAIDGDETSPTKYTLQFPNGDNWEYYPNEPGHNHFELQPLAGSGRLFTFEYSPYDPSQSYIQISPHEDVFDAILSRKKEEAEEKERKQYDSDRQKYWEWLRQQEEKPSRLTVDPMEGFEPAMASNNSDMRKLSWDQVKKVVSDK